MANLNLSFAQLVRLSRTSIAEEMREKHRRLVWTSELYLVQRVIMVGQNWQCIFGLRNDGETTWNKAGEPVRRKRGSTIQQTISWLQMAAFVIIYGQPCCLGR